jgi:CRP/FNR family cyclic AMP-dependent transcriptional regulator
MCSSEDSADQTGEVAALRDVGIFSQLTASELADISELLVERSFAAGSIIFEVGDPGDSCYVITAGTTQILQGGIGSERIMAELDATSVLGEGCLLHNEPRSATAKAKTDVTALRLSRSDFDHLLEEDHLGAYRMVLSMAAELHRRLRETTNLLYGLLLNPVPGEAPAGAEPDLHGLRDKIEREWSVY